MWTGLVASASEAGNPDHGRMQYYGAEWNRIVKTGGVLQITETYNIGPVDPLVARRGWLFRAMAAGGPTNPVTNRSMLSLVSLGPIS